MELVFSEKGVPRGRGKVERFFRTLLDECLYAQSFASDPERAVGLDAFVCYYNAERPHLRPARPHASSALGVGNSGVTNLLKDHT